MPQHCPLVADGLILDGSVRILIDVFSCTPCHESRCTASCRARKRTRTDLVSTCLQVFDIHHMVDAISVETYDGDDVTLQTICYKPFGQACAIESVAQYWQMDRSKYDSQHVSLQQCLSHWPIDCRCATSCLCICFPYSMHAACFQTISTPQ